MKFKPENLISRFTKPKFQRGADQFLTSFDVSEDTGSVLTAALPRMSAGAGAKKVLKLIIPSIVVVVVFV